MSKRKFYRTVIQVEILSDVPYTEGEEQDLAVVSYDIVEGEFSGQITTIVPSKEVTGKKMAKLLEKQGSSPDFFMLDENGNDLEE